MMKLSVSCIIASAVLASLPMGSSADSLKGFQDFVFGMTLQEASAIQSLSLASETDAGHQYESEVVVNILGKEYRQTLLFDDRDLLTQVNVYRELNEGDLMCTAEFEEVFGAVRARYGEADQPPNRTAHGGMTAITSAQFTEADGSKIKLAAVWLDNCLINVAYISGPGGSDF